LNISQFNFKTAQAADDQFGEGKKKETKSLGFGLRMTRKREISNGLVSVGSHHLPLASVIKCMAPKSDSWLLRMVHEAEYRMDATDQ
jgi:hypothetical protein